MAETLFFSGCREDGRYSDRACLHKQPTIFHDKKRVSLGETDKEKLPQYKNMGLGFKKLKEAMEGTTQRHCPFTGNVCIRGRILPGVVTKMKT